MVPSPGTIFRGVQKLQPGECVVFRDGVAKPRFYWTMRYTDRAAESIEVLESRFQRLLRESAARAIGGDTEIGAFLSGGTDSSTVAGLLTEMRGRPAHLSSALWNRLGASSCPHQLHMTKPSAHLMVSAPRAIRPKAPFDFAVFGLGLICIAFLFAMGYFLVVATFADEIRISSEIGVCGTGIIQPAVVPWPFFDGLLTRWIGPMPEPDPDYIFNGLAWLAFMGIALAFERWVSKPARVKPVRKQILSKIYG
jgi:hypothetical protein